MTEQEIKKVLGVSPLQKIRNTWITFAIFFGIFYVLGSNNKTNGSGWVLLFALLFGGLALLWFLGGLAQTIHSLSYASSYKVIKKEIVNGSLIPHFYLNPNLSHGYVVANKNSDVIFVNNSKMKISDILSSEWESYNNVHKIKFTFSSGEAPRKEVKLRTRKAVENEYARLINYLS